MSCLLPRVREDGCGPPLRYWDGVGGARGGRPNTYQINAVRSTTVGVAAQFVVNFGVAAGGEATASVAGGPELAA
jgi:hypothetical protein